MARYYRVVCVSQEAFPECLRYNDFNSAINWCHLDDQSHFVSFLLGISSAYLLGGLSIVGVGCLILQKACNGRCCSLFEIVTVSDDFS